MTLEQMKHSMEAGLLSGKYFSEEKFQWHWRDAVGTFQPLETVELPEKAVALRLYLYTEDHRYAISMGPSGTKPNGYLGCTVSARKPRPGEEWTRGNDLHDGEFDSQTIALILIDILGYECKRIAKRTPIVVNEETIQA